MVAA
jgi:hypothetical protein